MGSGDHSIIVHYPELGDLQIDWFRNDRVVRGCVSFKVIWILAKSLLSINLPPNPPQQVELEVNDLFIHLYSTDGWSNVYVANTPEIWICKSAEPLVWEKIREGYEIEDDGNRLRTLHLVYKNGEFEKPSWILTHTKREYRNRSARRSSQFFNINSAVL